MLMRAELASGGVMPGPQPDGKADADEDSADDGPRVPPPAS
jgi:hypothetical protein